LRRTAIMVLLPLISLAAVNWLMNPLMLFNSPVIDGLNKYKTQLFFALHVVKPYWAREYDPQAVILGSSRAGNGMDPAMLDATAFNYAIPGARIDLLSRIYGDVRDGQALEKVILTLDFFAFNASPSAITLRDQAINMRLRGGDVRPGANLFSLTFNDHFNALLSWQNTRNSLRTWRYQEAAATGEIGLIEYHRNGHWQQTLPRGRAQRENFRAIEREYMQTGWFPPPLKTYTFESPEFAAFDELESLLRTLHADRREVFLVISPLHARFMLAMELAGLGEEFVFWKRELVRINTQVANFYDSAAYPLWDFAIATGPNLEEVPAAGDRATRMEYFLDGQHYTTALGSIILKRLDEPALMPGFGWQLSTDSLDSRLREAESLLTAYRISHPADMQELSQTWRTVSGN